MSLNRNGDDAMNPIRCCIACKSRKSKSELIRIVINEDGKPIVDRNQKNNSRGIYICKDKSCIENIKKAIKKKKLKIKINIDENSLLKLLEELGEEIWEN